MTIFLLFGIVLFFGLLLIYTFKVITLSGLVYLMLIPISFLHYQKIKKQTETMSIELTKTVDIAKALGEKKTANQFNVGFALETENEVKNAQGKLAKKNFDMIVLNSLNDRGAGFKLDTNQITIIDKQNNIQKFELKSKTQVAKDILYEVEKRI